MHVDSEVEDRLRLVGVDWPDDSGESVLSTETHAPSNCEDNEDRLC